MKLKLVTVFHVPSLPMRVNFWGRPRRPGARRRQALVRGTRPGIPVLAIWLRSLTHSRGSAIQPIPAALRLAPL